MKNFLISGLLLSSISSAFALQLQNQTDFVLQAEAKQCSKFLDKTYCTPYKLSPIKAHETVNIPWDSLGFLVITKTSTVGEPVIQSGDYSAFCTTSNANAHLNFIYRQGDAKHPDSIMCYKS